MEKSVGKARKPTSSTRAAPAAAARPASGGGPCPVYVAYGPDDSLRSRELQTLVGQLEADGGSVTQIPGSPMPELAEVLDELRTMPLLGDRRVVVVRDANEFVSKYRERLEAYLAAPSDTGTLVLEVTSWPANTRLAKLVAQVGRSVESKLPKRSEMAGWLARHAATIGKALEPEAADLLRELLGDEEPAILLAEIEKLATYVNERPSICVEDVEALTSPLRTEKVFAVIDAVADRDAGRAVALWEQVLATDRQAEFRAVGGLAFKIRQLLRARRALEAGRTHAQAIREAKMWGNSVVLERRIESFTSWQLGAMLVRLGAIDLSSKTGGDVRTEVQNFLVAACGNPRRGQR